METQAGLRIRQVGAPPAAAWNELERCVRGEVVAEPQPSLRIRKTSAPHEPTSIALSHRSTMIVVMRLYQRPIEALRAVFGDLAPDDVALFELVDDIVAGTPHERIVAIRTLQHEVLPDRLATAVADGRRRGMTWTGIGRLLGISRQAVQQRYDTRVTRAR